MTIPDADPRQLLPDLDRLRGRVRADQRATSGPVLAFGALIVGYAAVVTPLAGQAGAAARHTILLAYWPLATIAALLWLWWSARRRTSRDGVGEGRHSYRTAARTYLLALVLILVACLPLLFVTVFAPLVWPGVVLGALAAWQHDRRLGRAAAVVVATGVVAAGYILASNGAAGWWLLPAMYAALGMGLLAVGGLVRRGERSAA